MIKKIVHDPMFLSIKSNKATMNDLNVAIDLLDTLLANKDKCVGMAANMIGINKNIIVFDDNNNYKIMFNPVIVNKSNPYTAKEGCLSLLGPAKSTTRYKNIVVEYEDMQFKRHKENFHDFTAQIIQHEIDHLNGILI